MNGPPNSRFEQNFWLKMSHRWKKQSSLQRRLAVLALILASGFAGAEEAVYTWRDSAGRVHYGNRPPENQPAKEVPLNAKPVTVQPTEQIYSWTDEAGRTHYGPQPPTGIAAKRLQEEDTSLSTIRPGALRPGEKALLKELP